MKLWHLRPIEFNLLTYPTGGIWDPYYGKAFGFVVRAETEKEARDISGKASGDEGADPWLDPTFTSCLELTPDDEPGVVIRDAHPG